MYLKRLKESVECRVLEKSRPVSSLFNTSNAYDPLFFSLHEKTNMQTAKATNIELPKDLFSIIYAVHFRKIIVAEKKQVMICSCLQVNNVFYFAFYMKVGFVMAFPLKFILSSIDEHVPIAG